MYAAGEEDTLGVEWLRDVWGMSMVYLSDGFKVWPAHRCKPSYSPRKSLDSRQGCVMSFIGAQPELCNHLTMLYINFSYKMGQPVYTLY